MTAVLLDRDGTINRECGYLHDPSLVELEEGAGEGLRLLANHGLALVVLTNQAGIGLGLMTEADARAVNARLAELLARHGVVIDGWYLCPCTLEMDCECRKPRTGMARQAAQDLHLDLRDTWVVGDKQSDVELAMNIGARGLLVCTGHGKKHATWAQAHGVPVLPNLLGACFHIARELGQSAPSKP